MPVPPTPTATLAARGSWRAKTRPDEPKLEPAKVRPPKDLQGDARTIWKTLAPKLVASGILTVADLPAFCRYCRVYTAWKAAMTLVEREPDRANVLALGKLDEMVRRLEAAFGLNPSDRTGIRVEKPADSNSKARFFETRSGA